jgi:hypothetical protein
MNLKIKSSNETAFEVKIDSQATVLTLKTMISGIYGLIRPFQRL